jgi:hypothetical protein
MRCGLARGFRRWRRRPRLRPGEGDRVGRSGANDGECRVNTQASCYYEIKGREGISGCTRAKGVDHDRRGVAESP